MNPKEFLQQAYYAQREVDIKLEQIIRLQSLATKTTSTLKNVPCGKSLCSVVENAVTSIEEQTTRLANEVKKMLEVIEKISATISLVENPQERIILKYRYLCCLPWATIAFLVKASERNVFLIHNQALKNFSNVLQ